jgi:hypothetical protein
VARLASPYLPRRPTESVLYHVVRDHLETFLAHARDTYSRPIPRYAEQELRAYLRCGIFAHGFLRCHCDTCGHDLLVAFSCKSRGICPSCTGRRMANTGAHLVDRVLPDVPVRQLVLSLPHELRRIAAFKPDVLTALCRIFVEVAFASYRSRAKKLHGVEGGAPGAITLIQRFGGSLNLHVHFHTVFLDGVFTRDESLRVHFLPLPPPSREELDAVVRRIQKRALTWLRKHGYTSEDVEARSNDEEDVAIEACARIAMHRGTFAKLANEAPSDGVPVGTVAEEPKLVAFLAEHEGWNLHAGVHIPAGDDLGRERLLRYGARPPLALDRLRRLPDGRITYRVKYARTRSKHRVMTPLEMLARLAALIPPPRYPLIRFHGVLGPRSSWRKDVVPRPRTTAASAACDGDAKRQREERRTPRRDSREVGHAHEATSSAAPPDSVVPSAQHDLPLASHGRDTGDRIHLSADQTESTAPRAFGSTKLTATLLAPNILSVHHWDRLAKGELYAASRRIRWAPLLRRTFDVDVERCPVCHGRLRMLGGVDDPVMATAVLERLDIRTDAPVPARARDPTELAECEWTDGRDPLDENHDAR